MLSSYILPSGVSVPDSPVMEVEKRKKKRVIRGEVEGSEGEGERLKKLKGEEGVGVGGSGDGEVASVVPTEEEVEEFFAILRRMKVAVKYFDDKGRGGKEWREVLEQAEVTAEDVENVVDDDREAAADGGAVKKNKGEEEQINEGLDLNAVAPEAAEGGDA